MGCIGSCGSGGGGGGQSAEPTWTITSTDPFSSDAVRTLFLDIEPQMNFAFENKFLTSDTNYGDNSDCEVLNSYRMLKFVDTTGADYPIDIEELLVVAPDGVNGEDYNFWLYTPGPPYTAY